MGCKVLLTPRGEDGQFILGREGETCDECEIWYSR